MPDMRLNQQEVIDLLEHIDAETRWLSSSAVPTPSLTHVENAVSSMNAWVHEADSI